MSDEPPASGRREAPTAGGDPGAPGGHRAASTAAPRSWRRIRRSVGWAALGLTALAAAGLVSVVTVDLGPTLRAQAEQQFASRIDRPVSIGRLSTYILPGRFLIEDLVIGGQAPGDRPFFVSERIVISTAWLPLLRGEVLVDDVDIAGWRMLVESGERGHTFPRLVVSDDAGAAPAASADPPAEPAAPADAAGERRIVTTVQHLRAHDGEFVYEDHGAPWSIAARNIDLTLTRTTGYGGEVSFNGGTLRIGDFEPMTVGMTGTYALDGSLVELTRIDLEMDGFDAVVDGTVDLLGWPESTYRVTESSIDLPTMKEIFFAREAFTTTGHATFVGEWHLFDGGRELTGRFASERATLGSLEFPSLEGALEWTPDRFEITRARSRFYGGSLDFTYAMQPLGADAPAIAAFAPRVERVALPRLLEALDVRGVRPLGSLSGAARLAWPLGELSQRSGEATLQVTPPSGATLQPRDARPTGTRRAPYAEVPFEPDGAPWRFPLGGEMTLVFGPEVIEVQPSWIATPLTAATLTGETAWGSRSRIPFEIVSADWQESSRLMAAFLTAVDRPTGGFDVAGFGTMRGTMRGRFEAPRIEATFDGDDVRAWNVAWGHGAGEVVVENNVVEVREGAFRSDASTVEVDGRFALGSPPPGAEEIDASFRLDRLPARQVRDAFGIDGYPIDGPLSGELRLFGGYRRPFGFGRLRIGAGSAYGETFDRTDAGLRFDGEGVWLDGLTVRKGDGEVTGAMYVRWDGTYSVNADGRNLDLATSRAVAHPAASVSGRLDFSASGVGAFDAPRYQVRGTVTDLAINQATVGQVTGRLDVQDAVLGVELEAASAALAVSGAGRIALTGTEPSELRLRVTNTRFDPFIRSVRPEFPEAATLVASGTLEVLGPLADVERLDIEATVEQLGMTWLDYSVVNDGPMRLALDHNQIHIDRMRLDGDGTALELTGSVSLANRRLALGVSGDASLGILAGFASDVRSRGQLRVRADIGGTIDAPTITGAAQIVDGRLRHFALPHSLDALNGQIVFERTGMRLDGVTGRFGGGPVRFDGGIRLRGRELGELNVAATFMDVNLRIPEGMRSTVDADLTLRGPVDAPTLAGEVMVRDAIWLESLLTSTGGFIDLSGGEPVPTPEAAPLGWPLRYDVRIVAPSSLRIVDNRTQIVASADVSLRGTFDQPALVGNAEIERGQIYFEGNRYRVTRGSVGFSNPSAIEPFFDVEVETDIRVPGQTYRVRLGLSGTLDRLAPPTLEADPPLQQFEIIGLLLGDVRDPRQAQIRTLRAREASQQELLQAAGARLLTSPLSSGVGGVIERSFGVDTFEITPSLDDPAAQQSSQLVPTARVLIGKRISDRAHVTFSRAVSGQNQDLIVILEYDASDRLSWVLSQNEDRTYALDFRVRHAF